MGRLDEYLEYLHNGIQKYGKHTTVLYQCGMFYEVYGVDNSTEKLGHVAEFAATLNIQATRTDKSIPENSRANPLMAGFPCVSLQRNVDILVNEGWTVVVVDQITPPPSVKRAITHVFSKGTIVEGVQEEENYLLSIFVQAEKKGINRVGMAAIDLTTGKNYVHETFSGGTEINEVSRFIQTFQPTEIIIHAIGSSRGVEPPCDLVETLDVSHIPHHYHENKLDVQLKLSYQNEKFAQFFPDHGINSPIEFINLERFQCALISYLVLLEFCYDHNKDAVLGISPPEKWNNSQHLILDGTALEQLNLPRVIKQLDSTSTLMGRRLLKERILIPIIDKNKLESRYNAVTMMLENLNDSESHFLLVKKERQLWQVVEEYLSKMGDLERAIRRIETGIFQPAEFAKLDETCKYIDKLLKFVEASRLNNIISVPDKEKWETVQNSYGNVLNMDEASKVNLEDIKTSIFKKGFNCEIDTLQDAINKGRDSYSSILEYFLEKFTFNAKKAPITLKLTDENTYLLEMTPAKFAEIERIYKRDAKRCDYDFAEFTVSSRLKSSIKLMFPNRLVEQASSLQQNMNELIELSTKFYRDFLKDLKVRVCPILRDVVACVSEIDVYKASAKVALKFNYTRPTILPSEEGGFIDASDLRHVLIERINQREPYVPHNIRLAVGEGMLLYGVNKSGKSSLMKACGIAVTLAQAGMFVPASSMRFSPYHSLMTRILSSDNIFKGLSSFAVEMSEIKTITDFNDNYSLILGDEVCHGTETESAVALVAGVVMYLRKKKSNFIFATHYHQLSELRDIAEDPGIKQCHLEVVYNEERDELVYNRKIKDGSGPATYGIEVARAMKIRPEIIVSALEIRSKRKEGAQQGRESSYNKDVYYTTCQIGDCCETGCEIHHIQWQSSADKNGFIAGTSQHKDLQNNLVCLCRAHHNMVHNPKDTELIIWGWRGGKLQYEERKKLMSLWREVDSTY